MHAGPTDFRDSSRVPSLIVELLLRIFRGSGVMKSIREVTLPMKTVVLIGSPGK
jgi:hypothetical protein